jgi:DNA-binding transcriptional ArsR family regulator
MGFRPIDQERRAMSQASIKVSEGRLPAALAAALDPHLREALENPTRREVLRSLHGSDRALEVVEIASELGEFTVSEVAYHLRVLERSGGATVANGRPSVMGERRRYVSGVADNGQALAALRATQQWDRTHQRRGDRRSSAHLTIFRVPRPTRTIRLGERDREGRNE